MMTSPATASAFQMLSADDPGQLAEWLRLWHTWPDYEVMAHPEYVRLFARPGDEVFAASYAHEQGAVLFPVILRPLAAEPWTPPGETGFDLTSAYGYGGPFAWGRAFDHAAEFWSGFDRWARAREVVTAFTRLSLFPHQLLPWHGEILPAGPNILRRLEGTEEDLWADYVPKVRQNVRRARARGCLLQVDPTGDRLDEFHEVYIATMTRHNAESQYFFPREFFESIARNLPRYSAFFHVVHGNRVVSSELVLLSKRHAYFFLGGTYSEAFELRASEFLQHETFLWCRQAGKRELVLGGGYKNSEGLLKYKRGFAPRGEVPFLLGTRTFNPDASVRLVEARRRWEASLGRIWTPEPGFFPAYRSGGELRSA